MKLHSKQDVAKSQLEEAIRLFFEGRDPISVHTLIGAAHQIMRDVAYRRKIQYQCIIEMLPEKEKIKDKGWYTAVFTPRNFFKHADMDDSVILGFDPSENELWLLDACSLFGQIFQIQSKAVDAFWSWYQLKYPAARDFLSVTRLVKLADLMNISADDFEYFRDHCD